MRMQPGEPLLLALLQGLLQENLQAALLRLPPAQRAVSSLLAPLVLAVPPQEPLAARLVWQSRVERMQVLRAPQPEAARAVPRVELEPPAWPRRELVQPELAGEGLQEQEEPQPPEGVADVPLRLASSEPL